jgi:hypothetical protein
VRDTVEIQCEIGAGHAERSPCREIEIREVYDDEDEALGGFPRRGVLPMANVVTCGSGAQGSRQSSWCADEDRFAMPCGRWPALRDVDEPIGEHVRGPRSRRYETTDAGMRNGTHRVRSHGIALPP